MAMFDTDGDGAVDLSRKPGTCGVSHFWHIAPTIEVGSGDSGDFSLIVALRLILRRGAMDVVGDSISDCPHHLFIVAGCYRF